MNGDGGGPAWGRRPGARSEGHLSESPAFGSIPPGGQTARGAGRRLAARRAAPRTAANGTRQDRRLHDRRLQDRRLQDIPASIQTASTTDGLKRNVPQDTTAPGGAPGRASPGRAPGGDAGCQSRSPGAGDGANDTATGGQLHASASGASFPLLVSGALVLALGQQAVAISVYIPAAAMENTLEYAARTGCSFNKVRLSPAAAIHRGGRQRGRPSSGAGVTPTTRRSSTSRSSESTEL